ncbi:tyrosine-type recombinase/integrase [Spirillospora sp. NPDC048911]|uniref:tyrosine-type recombinase/integrase n=1 Tax=Spirillospora sp. NPDC048911 TaxID=3364527 RepID=UPI00371B1A4C
MAAPIVQGRVHPHLLEHLVEVVRPEFRAEIFHPPRDSAVFFSGLCTVISCPTAISHTARGLCEGHYQRWKIHEKRRPGTGFEEWLLAEEEHTRARNAPPKACLIRGCNRASRGRGLCHRHGEAWTRAGRPNVEDWAGRTLYQLPQTGGERVCCFPTDCPRWTDGPDQPLCRPHWERWRTRGRPDLETWFAELAHGKDPRVDLGRLERHLRLEVQFGLQCRHDEATKRALVRTIREAVNLIVRATAEDPSLTSLLDWDERQWRTTHAGGKQIDRTTFATTALAFVLDTRLRLHMLLVADDPWADQYPRDTWDLRILGIQHEAIRYLRFGEVPQPWLRDLAKRWVRWRLSQDIDPSTLAINLKSLRKFAAFLSEDLQPAGLDRDAIEAWLAKLRIDWPDADTRRAQIASLSTFLRDVHRHAWQPGLSPTAFCFEDTPPRKVPKPRWIPEEVMAQMEAPTNLALFPSDDGRLILKILINCGLRLKDARKLPFDCVIRDASGAPYLAWINYKMRSRPAFFPISESMAADIADQQHRVRDRFENGSPWLFPGHQANLDGARPASASWWRSQLGRWLEGIELVYNDKPIRVTAHQFRHTLGTRLINADVPQHVVQQLLDHMSPQMTAVYARLLDKTVREHWERATKVNAEGQIAEPEPDHPLADAQWMRLSMVRAKVTLPNGYCGAPIQTDCEYANPCLDCRFFLTTAEFLPLHQRQLEETTQLIADAKASGLTRVVEKNTKTLIKLENLITSLRSLRSGQIVAGGQVEDLNAAG